MKVNNVELNVRISGDGMPFIWGHGLMASMSFDDCTDLWHSDNLVEITKLIRYDARGHGLSEGTHIPEDYLWPNLAKDMIGIADELGLDRFAAGGQSMGCMVSLCAALVAPERIRALVLVNPSTVWETRPDQAALYGKIISLVEALGIVAFAGLLRQQSLLPDLVLQARPQASEEFLKSIQAMDEKVLLQVLRGASMSDLPPRERLSAITIPVLILAWPNDSTHPIENADELKALLPQSQLVIAQEVDDLKKWPDLISRFIGSLS